MSASIYACVRACLTSTSDSRILDVCTVITAESTEWAVEQMILPAITFYFVHHDAAASWAKVSTGPSYGIRTGKEIYGWKSNTKINSLEINDKQ